MSEGAQGGRHRLGESGLGGSSLIDDPYRDVVIGRLADLLERSRYSGDDVAELLWATSLSMIDRQIERARERRWWKSNPAGELRAFRGRLAEAMALARFAAALQEADNAGEWEAEAPAREAAAAERAARRRAQTLPAELARLASAAARRERAAAGTNFHLRADYPAGGLGAVADERSSQAR